MTRDDFKKFCTKSSPTILSANFNISPSTTTNLITNFQESIKKVPDVYIVFKTNINWVDRIHIRWLQKCARRFWSLWFQLMPFNTNWDGNVCNKADIGLCCIHWSTTDRLQKTLIREHCKTQTHMIFMGNYKIIH